MKRLALIALSATAAACMADTAGPMDTIDTELELFGTIIATSDSVLADAPQFGASTSHLRARDPVAEDLRSPTRLGREVTLAPSVEGDLEMEAGSAIFENRGVFVYTVDHETIRLREGDLFRDIDVPRRGTHSIMSADGRLMVRQLHTLDWTVHAVDGTTERFTQPSTVVVFDVIGDTVLVGHKHGEIRTLHTVVRR